MEEETIARLTLTDEYAYHIGQIASVTTTALKVVKKQLSFKEPYTLEIIPASAIARVDYKKGLVPLRIVFGALLLMLLAGIAYYAMIYWDRLELPRSVKITPFVLAGIYGMSLVFMSRQHKLIFDLHDGRRVIWRSRSGDFKIKEKAVSNVLKYFRTRGLFTSNDFQ